jgi:asparagine synthase (glutamine-hydrolysing)
MPGIVGIIGRAPAGEKLSEVQRMVKCMVHGPSYTSGTYGFERLGLCVGWASHAGSFSDCMPVWNKTGDVCLIFTGEDFRDSAELDALKAAGHECGAGTADYLVHLYEETGTGFFEKLNGWFSGLLVDLREHKVVLFNDRYGLGRVYYHEDADNFYFASEAKSLLKVLPELRQFDLAGLAETFSCGCALQNRTLFTGISLLPSGAR